VIVVAKLPWIFPLTQQPRRARVWDTKANAFADAFVPLYFQEWIVYHLSVAGLVS